MRKIDLNTRRVVVDRSHPTSAAVGVDTMRAITLNEVPEDDVRALKFRFKKVKHRRGYRMKFCSNEGPSWSFWFDSFEDGRVNFQVDVPPKATANEILEVIENNLGAWALDAKITRLDVHLTLPMAFRKCFNGLDFGKKRAVLFYKMTSYGQSFYVGMVKGQKKHELVIYDKREESLKRKRNGLEPITHPCTRFEINTRPKKDMLVRELMILKDHRPFKHVRRFAVNLKEPAQGKNLHQYIQKRDRYIKFNTMHEYEGFFMARRLLNIDSNANFHALYGDFYELEELEPSLDDLCSAGMKKFCK